MVVAKFRGAAGSQKGVVYIYLYIYLQEECSALIMVRIAVSKGS